MSVQCSKTIRRINNRMKYKPNTSGYKHIQVRQEQSAFSFSLDPSITQSCLPACVATLQGTRPHQTQGHDCSAFPSTLAPFFSSLLGLNKEQTGTKNTYTHTHTHTHTHICYVRYPVLLWCCWCEALWSWLTIKRGAVSLRQEPLKEAQRTSDGRGDAQAWQAHGLYKEQWRQ